MQSDNFYLTYAHIKLANLSVTNDNHNWQHLCKYTAVTIAAADADDDNEVVDVDDDCMKINVMIALLKLLRAIQ